MTKKHSPCKSTPLLSSDGNREHKPPIVVEPMKDKLLNREGGANWAVVPAVDVRRAVEWLREEMVSMWKEGKLPMLQYQRIGLKLDDAFEDVMKDGYKR
jgi:hypothetical protein